MTTENIVVKKTKSQIEIRYGSTSVDITDMGMHIWSDKKLEVTHPKSVIRDNYMIVWF